MCIEFHFYLIPSHVRNIYLGSSAVYVGLLSLSTDSQSRQRGAGEQPQSQKFLHKYVSYSIPSKLRKYSNPPFPDEDPELDVEAQFASHVVREAQKRIEKKRRLQCLSGWLWCKLVS